MTNKTLITVALKPAQFIAIQSDKQGLFIYLSKKRFVVAKSEKKTTTGFIACRGFETDSERMTETVSDLIKSGNDYYFNQY